MGNTNSLRCCLACVLPCGALDLIRIVHLNGYVDEITRPITAGEVLEANPNHVLSKPSSQGVVRRILILSPETELKRGSIYFLIPKSSLPAEKKQSRSIISDSDLNKKAVVSPSSKRRSNNKSVDDGNDEQQQQHQHQHHRVSNKGKKSSRRKAHQRVGIWRPHLESITEDL